MDPDQDIHALLEAADLPSLPNLDPGTQIDVLTALHDRLLAALDTDSD